MRLARELGVLSLPNVTVVTPEPASDELIGLVHEPAYIEAVRRAGADPAHADAARGLGSLDTPAFPGMHEASALVVGATLAAAGAVWSGRAEHGVNIAGGLHHAMPGAASGFCVYNDPAVAIAWLLATIGVGMTIGNAIGGWAADRSMRRTITTCCAWRCPR